MKILGQMPQLWGQIATNPHPLPNLGYVGIDNDRCLNIMIMYIKLHKLSWIRNYQNPQKLNEQTYPTVQTVTVQHNEIDMPYN